MFLEKLTLSDSEGSQDTDEIQHDSTPTPTPTPTPTATPSQTATPVSTAPTKNVTVSPAPLVPAVPGKLFCFWLPFCFAICYRPFTSSKNFYFQNEAKCKIFLVKISFV